MIDAARQDLKHSIRLLLRSPSFAVIGIASLGLGIGAAVSMFTIVNAVLLRPLPLESPERLVFLFHGTAENPYGSLSYPDYLDYRDGSSLELAAYGEVAVSLSSEDAPELVRGVIASGNFFEVLGVRAHLGRALTPDDDRAPGEHPIVVLSHGLWRRRFAGDPAIVGKEATVNGRPYVVVGVTPEGFRGPEVFESYELYVPMMMQAQMRPPRAGFSGEMDPDLLTRRNASWLRGIGRLGRETSIDEAQSSLTLVAQRLEAAYPDTNRNERATLFPLSRVDPRAYPVLRSIAALLLAVASLVLLVAAANVTSLFLARAVSRRREVALRLSLGGSRSRLVRQFLTESLVLALLGGAFGLLVASWTLHGLERLVPASGIFSFTPDFPIDGRVVGFTAAVALLSSLLVGLAPALQGSRPDLVGALRDANASGRPAGSRLGGRNALVLAQLALSIVLLVGSGLFLESFRRSSAIAPGFAAEEVLTVDLRLDLLRYTRARGRDFYREVVERVSGLPGVRSCSLARVVPLAGGGRTTTFALRGAAPVDPVEDLAVSTNVVGLDYFRTMGIDLVSGRDFSPFDVEGSPRVVIASESFAWRYFPSGALGQRVRLGGADSEWSEIVGIARDSKLRRLGEETTPHLYQPLSQQHETGMVLLVRTASAPALAAPEVRRTVLSLEPNLPASRIEPLASLVRSSLFPARMAARLLTAFALLALVLAAVGLYGVTAFAVSRRTREMGIRVALGARPNELVKLVVGEALVLVGVGVGLGWLAALAGTRLLASFLYGVSPTDPATFLAVGLLLALVMLATAYGPARRAAGSDPLDALRYE